MFYKSKINKGCFIAFTIWVLSCTVAFSQSDSFNFVYKDCSEAITRNMLDVQFFLFVSESKSIGYTQMQILTDTTEKIIKDDQVYLKRNRPADTQRIHIYKDYLNKKLIFETGVNPFFERNTFFVDSLDVFRWELKNESKLIDSFLCYKAETIFRGRNYIAWYTPSIPLADGPWKFNGLPGLIMEIQDSEDVVHWKITNVYINKSYLADIPLKIDGDYAAFKTLMKQKLTLYQKAMESSQDVTDPLCVGCKSSRTIKIRMPENVF